MINIGNRRELFTDDYLIDTEKTTAKQIYCKPVKREAAFIHDAPWENMICVYHNILRLPDGKYRMFYKAVHYGPKPDGTWTGINHICAIESEDGIHWSRPDYEITPFHGDYKNNIISPEFYYFDNLFVIEDKNPDCPPDKKYKALYGEWGSGLFKYFSEDGLHFEFMIRNEKGELDSESAKMMTIKETGCYFDSLNTVYWDPQKGKYIAFLRGFHVGDDLCPPDPDVEDAVRDIRFSESEDFKTWTYPQRIKFNDDNDYQLYANAVTIYPRAPHMYIATPTRYVARKEWNDSFDKLPNAEDRKSRGRGLSITDAIFMSSRDGENWTRCGEAIFTPGPEQKRNWVYGDCYPCVGMVETPGEIPGTDPYLSLYCKEDVDGQPCTLYRYSLRMDGFACRRATLDPQYVVTKPFVFGGKELEINFKTSALGYMKFTLEAEDGTAIHSGEVFGDKIDRIVGFEDGNVADFAGKTVTLKIEMSDASIYAIKFN